MFASVWPNQISRILVVDVGTPRPGGYDEITPSKHLAVPPTCTAVGLTHFPSRNTCPTKRYTTDTVFRACLRSIRGPQYLGVGVFSANMVLNPNTLVAGSSYTFSLFATYSSASRRRLQDSEAVDTSSSSISLSINTPPSGGTFEVSPSAGMGCYTHRIRCVDCHESVGV